MSEDEDRYTRITLRLPKELHAQLSDGADRTSKSINAEIVDRLTRTFEGDDAAKLARANTVLLRTLSDFVLLRHDHPEVMTTMEEPILRMARAVKDTEDDTQIMKNAQPGFLGFVRGLTEALNRATELMGPGWSKRTGPGAETTDPAHLDTSTADERDAPPTDQNIPPKTRKIQVEVRKKRTLLAFPKPSPKP